ncbi:MAG: hypothetical protein DMF00_14150 [Verrucomicrobia bacterium]|nr:MAG: hypothetical protein DMF00_14150 [Verrucomicrobiota bacterium]
MDVWVLSIHVQTAFPILSPTFLATNPEESKLKSSATLLCSVFALISSPTAPLHYSVFDVER